MMVRKALSPSTYRIFDSIPGAQRGGGHSRYSGRSFPHWPGRESAHGFEGERRRIQHIHQTVDRSNRDYFQPKPLKGAVDPQRKHVELAPHEDHARPRGTTEPEHIRRERCVCLTLHILGKGALGQPPV